MQLTCPKCFGTVEVIPILYGSPTFEMMQEAKKGGVFIGGCIITKDSPTHFCKKCRIKFDRIGRTYEVEDGEGMVPINK